ncbi:MAG: guanylate kinase [Oscillospiraceae bacterium]|nr:guanylate kinase [Oscillospiraceae bacterium]
MSKKGLLVVYSGFSGVGKGTIMKEMLKREETFRLSVSATTRAPRPGEVDGREYYFITKEKFLKMIDNDEFLEYAQYADNYYGTPKKAVEDMLNEGYNVFLEIEVQGGLQIMEKCPDCLSIFIVPPSLEVLEQRLRGRGTETEEVIEKRMKAALDEQKYTSRYDFVVKNDIVEDAVNDVINIVKTEKEKRNN